MLKYFGITVLHSCLSGAVAAAVGQALWYIVTGHLASTPTALFLGQVGISAVAITNAVRARRELADLVASYQQPAFGADVDVPGRPPADDSGEHDHKER
ncbi:hypothetical protein [Streptomyces sp. NRRL F-5053]|uniref:hypothetical protein n=1 Tax=Streptomyces sp. NRRL F-5053 TaxID=1463854 RepID=UPI0013314068|nr:hypothetical protein [Streptomyces sp. NRRL F-5053]